MTDTTPSHPDAVAFDEAGTEERPLPPPSIVESVITELLGAVPEVDHFVVENLFASDLAFLQDLYRRINQEGHTRAAVTCPACKHEFSVDVAGGRLGES